MFDPTCYSVWQLLSQDSLRSVQVARTLKVFSLDGQWMKCVMSRTGKYAHHQSLFNTESLCLYNSIYMSILYFYDIFIYLFMLFISYYFTSLDITLTYSAQQLLLVFASDSSDLLFLSLRRWVQYIEQTEMKPKRNRTFIRSIWVLWIRRYVKTFSVLRAG